MEGDLVHGKPQDPPTKDDRIEQVSIKLVEGQAMKRPLSSRPEMTLNYQTPRTSEELHYTNVSNSKPTNRMAKTLGKVDTGEVEKVSHQRLHLFQGGDGLVAEIGPKEEKDGRKRMEAAYTKFKERRLPQDQGQR